MRYFMASALAAAAIAIASPTVSRAVATASATITASQLGPSLYQYNLTLTDLPTSASPVGTFWYAWVPGENFMATAPTNITNPAGWTDAITHGGSSDGYAIQWKTSTAALTAGNTLTGFSYESADSPAVEFGNSPFFTTTPITTSFVYGGAPFSDAGTQFTVSAVPEPTALAAGIPASLMLLRRRRSAK